jgi:hypothetical protein
LGEISVYQEMIIIFVNIVDFILKNVLMALIVKYAKYALKSMTIIVFGQDIA